MLHLARSSEVATSRILEMLCENICLFRKWTGVSFSGAPGIFFSSPWNVAFQHLVFSIDRKGTSAQTYQLLKNTHIEQLLRPPTVP